MDEIRNGSGLIPPGNVRVITVCLQRSDLDRIRGRNLAKFGGGIGRHIGSPAQVTVKRFQVVPLLRRIRTLRH